MAANDQKTHEIIVQEGPTEQVPHRAGHTTAEDTSLISAYLTNLEHRERSPHTILAARRDLHAYLSWHITSLGESWHPGSTTPSVVRSYRAFLLKERQLAPASVSRHLASLRGFFRWLVAAGLIPSNPAHEISGPAQQSPGPRWLERRDILRLRREVERAGVARDLAVLETLLCGLRVAEAAALRWPRDISLGERSLRFTVLGKGRKQRVVPGTSDARRALALYLADRGEEDGPLFIGQRGGLTPDGFRQLLAHYSERAGVEATPHTLRHTAAKRLLTEAGADLLTVAALLGHERLDTTRRYTEPSLQDLETAVARIGSE